jgi:formyl-CoA transferase
MNFLVGGETPVRMGTAHPNLVPYQVFASKDGSLMLAVGNDKQFANCCDALDLSDLAQDDRFSTARARVVHRESLIPLLAARFSERGSEDWLDILRDRSVPAGPVNNIAEVLTNDYAVERQLVRHFLNSNDDSVPFVPNPVAFSETPVDHERAPPLLGEHTNEVLRDWLGYSDAEIETLKKSDVI